MSDKKELSRIAKLVGDRVNELKGVKTQREIARIAGYNNQNMITMIKLGDSKVALDRAAALGRALEVEPRDFMLLALEQFYSKTLIDQIIKDLCPAK